MEKKPKTNLLEEMEKLREGRLTEINTSVTFPLMRWLCGIKLNVPIANRANLLFFKVKPKYILSVLHFGMNKHIKFFRYPKPKKIDMKKLDILKKYLKKLYGWSDREFDANKRITVKLIDDAEYIEDLSKRAAWDDSERRAFGMKKMKRQTPKPKAIGIFDF